MTDLPIHGRGASWNPPNRFEPITFERDDWDSADDPLPHTQFFRDATRSILAHNDSPDIGFDVSINPYRGCEHGCVYCAWGETPILMGDGTTRRLADLRAGEEVYGTIRDGWYRKYTRTSVLAHWESEKPAYRITLEDGTELIASADHRFLTLRGWKFVTGAEQGTNRRPHLTGNDQLMGIGALGTARPATSEYAVGYLCGIIRGDGHLATHDFRGTNGRPGRIHQFRLALIDSAALARTARHLADFGVETTAFVFQRGSGNKREMRGIRTQSHSGFDRITQLVAWPEQPSAEWSRGFLAGIFDAEGSYSGGILRIPNTDAAIVETTVQALRRFGFAMSIERVARQRTRPITIVRLRGGLAEHLRFFHTVDPAILRKREIAGQALKSRARLRVVSIEPVGTMPLFDITTGTGDFIANGVVSHNCYARPTHEYFGLSAGLDFETKIFVKQDAPELLRKELSSPRWKPRVIAISGVTDPYQPVERRLQLTRRCLEVLVEFRNPVGIVTKNFLVTRDVDLLGELAQRDAAAVMVSVTTLDNQLQHVMEPRTSIPARRLAAIETLAKAGIPVGVLVAPVIPGLTDHEMPSILEAAAAAGATQAGYVLLRLPYAVASLFETWLAQHFPDRKDKVLNRMRELRSGRLYDSRWGVRQRGEGVFAEQIARLFGVSCQRFGLNRDRPALSAEAFRRPGAAAGPQLEMFGS